MQLKHAHGYVTIDQGDVVNHTAGKNLITRKDWEKDERVPAAALRHVIVRSRDRLVYRFDAADGSGKSVISVEGIDNKADLDAFFAELAAVNPGVVVELAHPSDGLSDPEHEAAVKAAKEATKFNEEEEKRRKAAAEQKPEVKVKTYDKPKDYEHDAPKMAKDGWTPEGQTGSRGNASLAGTGAKLVLTGGLGAITGFSRKGDKITVTWVRHPKPYVPREYVVVPPIPAPRTFPHEPYFAARLVQPVPKGQEFTPGSAAAPAPIPPVALPPVAAAMPVASTPISAPVDPPANGARSTADKLRELAALRDEGVISPEEFESTKAKLLGTF